MKLELYYFPECPFCQIVLRSIQKLKIKVEYKHIYQDRSAMEKLIKDTGRKTVPCLYIDNKPMLESSDIVRWLEANQNNLEKEA